MVTAFNFVMGRAGQLAEVTATVTCVTAGLGCLAAVSIGFLGATAQSVAQHKGAAGILIDAVGAIPGFHEAAFESLGVLAAGKATMGVFGVTTQTGAMAVQQAIP